MKKVLFVLLISISISSCVPVLKTQTSKTLDIYGSGVIQMPMVVDLNIQETQVTGTATGSNGLEAVKQQAVANALKKVNADVMVEPKFETKSSGIETTATVTGWPATYKNFRQIKQEDIPLLEVGLLQKAHVYEPGSLSNEKPASKTRKPIN